MNLRLLPGPAVPPTTVKASTVDGTNSPSSGGKDTQTVAREFEGILVRQLLSAAKMTGSGDSGYGAMAVDAMAEGISKAGGLGLARQIEEALRGGSRK